MRKVSKTIAILSTALLGITILLIVAGTFADPFNYALSFGNDFHIGVWTRDFDSRLVFFNDRQYGLTLPKDCGRGLGIARC
jgi:hypothetical protein